MFLNSFIKKHGANRLLHWLKAERWSRQGIEPILVFQMGRVGSSTVAKSVGAAVPDRPVYQLHYLVNRPIPGGNPIWAAEYLRRQWPPKNPDTRWKIISLTRDPVARNVSTFFYNLSGYLTSVELERLSPSELLEVFLERFDQHELPLEWFDKELKGFFGVDVYATDFPKDQGWATYSAPGLDLLIIKLEQLSDAEPIVSEFLGIENLAWTETNSAKNSSYFELYRSFSRENIFPSYYVDNLLDSQYARHFYEERELHAFRERWTNTPASRA